MGERLIWKLTPRLLIEAHLTHYIVGGDNQHVDVPLSQPLVASHIPNYTT